MAVDSAKSLFLEFILSNSIKSSEEILTKIHSYENEQARLKQAIAAKKITEDKLQNIADKMSLLVDEESQLAARFTLNMTAFEQHFPDIYQFFSTYTPEKMHISVHEHFANVVEHDNGKMMYDFPAYLMALAQVDAYQASPLSSTSKFFHHDEKLGEFLHSKKLNPIISILQGRVDSAVEKSKVLPKHLNALTVFGIGLGYHIELLVQQHSIGSVYLLEPDLDVFYASLFTANWHSILETMDLKGGNLHFSLGPQEDEFFEQLLKETYLNGRYEVAKTHLYVHYNTPEVTSLVNQYKTRFFEMIQGWGFFDDGIMAMSHFLASVKMGVPIIKKKVPFDIDIATVPVFIVGNGPSLDEHIDFIKAHSDKAIIISCASALSALYKCGVEIDLHCEQERIFAVAEKINYYAPADYIKKQTLLAPSTVHPAVYEKFARAMMAPKASEPSTSLLLQNKFGNEMFEQATHITPTVANTALVVATKMGFRQFYFIGVDLGRKQSGKHHSQHSFYYDEEGKDIDLYPEMENEFINKGNFSGEFISDPIFNMSKISLERFIGENSHIKCHNVSDGVLVKGALPLPQQQLVELLASVNTIDKVALVDKAYQLSAYHDDGELYQMLDASVDTQGFADMCQWLIDDLALPIDTMEDAVKRLRSQSHIVREVELAGNRHLSLLINGSVLHMQAMLVRLLYESADETIALADFKAGLVHYQEFLQEAPDVYREQYKTPMNRETEHLAALRKLQ
jgi:hypothetical protein